MEKINIIIQSEDIDKFLKNYKDGLKAQNNRIIIIGTELKVESLNIIQRLQKAEKITNEIQYMTVLGEKKNTILIIIGMAFESGEPIKYVSAIDKDILSLAQSIGVSMEPYTVTEKPKPKTKRCVTEKSKTDISETVIGIKEEGTIKKTSENIKKTKAIGEKVKKPKEINCIKELTQFITTANIPQEDKETLVESLDIVYEAIVAATEAEIGYPLQMKIRFGKIGENFAQVTKGSFNQIKTEIQQIK